MKPARFLSLAVLILIFAFSSLAYADVPGMINYQGKITDPQGALVDTTIAMVFTIYDAATDGGVLWTETQSSVVVEKGIFSVLLGSINAIPDSVFPGDVRYLGVKVGSDPEMSPRKAMVSVAYAYRAGTADGGAGSSGWVDDGTVIRLETSTDSVGVGTASPIEKLDVDGNIHASGTITSGSSITIDGTNDKITATSGTIDFDNENIVTTGKATIGPGHSNTGSYAFVAGVNNTASAAQATVGGGFSNTASGIRSTVGGGLENTASSDYYTTVGGGWRNTASSDGATVSGGTWNTASGRDAAVGGGNGNTASGRDATVGGGAGNTASDSFATVGGGLYNTASGDRATIGGGERNLVEGDYSAILGGYADTITSTADYSYLFGIGSKLTQDSTFMLDVPHIHFGDESNGYQFPTTDGSADQVMATNGSGQLSWTTVSGAGDNDWTFRITDTADTILMTGGEWGIARCGNTLYGNGDSTHVNLGVACTTGISGQDWKYCTVGGGVYNTASGIAATVGGGDRNTASGWRTTVGGGWNNTASGWSANVGGGEYNVADYAFATIGGGRHNTAGDGATVGGGGYNTASGPEATAGGGWNNTASGEQSTVGGGNGNTANGNKATIGGGYSNTASHYDATVGGGRNNTASGVKATVGGGASNTASGDLATVGGGRSNTANYAFATVGGGDYNTASGDIATIGGGGYNIAYGYASTIPGGELDTVAGDYSFATGRKVKIDTLADYTFAFGYNFTTSTPHAVIFYDADTETKVGIQTTSPTARLDVNSSTGYNQVRMRTSYTPTGTSDTNGNVGDVAWDDSYFYVKTSAGWKRSALGTW